MLIKSSQKRRSFQKQGRKPCPMSEKVIAFITSIDNLDEEDTESLIKEVEDVGKKYEVDIFYTEMCEFEEVP